MLLLGFLLLAPAASRAEHHPSPGTSFEQLLALTRAAIDARQNERAARFALIARARILVRPNPYANDALVRIFEDTCSPAATRARQYVAMVGDDREVLESLGPVSAALEEIESALAAQAASLIERNFKKCAVFVIEPLWAFDPERALVLLEQIDAIPDAIVPKEDDVSNTSMRMSECMARGVGGKADVAIGEESDTIREIKELRKSSGLTMVDVARTALTEDQPWVAIALARVSPMIFPLNGERFNATREEAWKALAKRRADASKAVLAKWFSPARKVLKNSGWTVTDGVVRFPPARAQRGLFLSSKKINGDFTFTVNIDTDFDHRQVGLVFAYKNNDDFCALFVKRFDGKPGFLMSHYVKGEPTPFGKWIESSEVVAGEDIPGWPLALERHGDMMCFAIGEFAWSFVPAKDLDLTGAVGLFCDDQQTNSATAEASRLDIEELPRAETNDD